MEKITEEMGVHKEWYAQAKDQTLETLPKFLEHIMNDYDHDYGTICHALAAGGIATMWAMNKHSQGGITGFQAGCIMWSFIQNWNRTGNKTGLRLVDFDNMLYPQYENQFQKTISENTWKSIQEQAKKNIEANGSAHPNVIAHWERIASGKIPFGYSIAEN